MTPAQFGAAFLVPVQTREYYRHAFVTGTELYPAIDDWWSIEIKKRCSSMRQCSPIDLGAMITKLPVRLDSNPRRPISTGRDQLSAVSGEPQPPSVP